MERKKILAISGSTRKQSVNRQYIQVIQSLAPAGLQVDLFAELDGLPHFNPDLDGDEPPAAVTRFRSLLRAADGVIICTPEYAMGVPGSLKNALDWTVSSCEFSKKPVALITASTSGKKAHEALLATLEVIEARMEPASKLLVSFARTKLNAEGQLVDESTRSALEALIGSLMEMMDSEEE